MRPLALSQVARWVEGRHLGTDATISSVSTDTRALRPGALYVALRGERVDGHDLAAQAAEAGAAALLVQREVESALPQVLCADTQDALGELAAGVQQGRPAVVVALTGSNGKTSVKALARICASFSSPKRSTGRWPMRCMNHGANASSAFTTATPSSGSASYTAPFVSAIPSSEPMRSMCAGITLFTSATCGGAIDARYAMSPGWPAPIS